MLIRKLQPWKQKPFFADLENIFVLKIEFPNSNSPIIFFSLSLRKHLMYCGGDTNKNFKYTRLVESYASYLTQNSWMMHLGGADYFVKRVQKLIAFLTFFKPIKTAVTSSNHTTPNKVMTHDIIHIKTCQTSKITIKEEHEITLSKTKCFLTSSTSISFTE